MISQINSYNLNTSFYGAKLKAPQNTMQKIKESISHSKIKNKVSDTFTKIKSEFKNMDEETTDLLIKTSFLFIVLVGFLAYIGHLVKLVMDKIQYFVE